VLGAGATAEGAPAAVRVWAAVGTNGLAGWTIAGGGALDANLAGPAD
jgi:hypothetical protein